MDRWDGTNFLHWRMPKTHHLKSINRWWVDEMNWTCAEINRANNIGKMFNQISLISHTEFISVNSTSMSPEDYLDQDLWSSFISLTSTTLKNQHFINITDANHNQTLLFDESNFNGNLLEIVWNGIWFILLRARLLFYLVWPSETMFPSLEQVPRYVTEVSCLAKRV